MTKYTIKELEWKETAVGFHCDLFDYDIAYHIIKSVSTGGIGYFMDIRGEETPIVTIDSFNTGKQICQQHFEEFMKKGLEKVEP